jgi:hypothetical protein
LTKNPIKTKKKANTSVCPSVWPGRFCHRKSRGRFGRRKCRRNDDDSLGRKEKRKKRKRTLSVEDGNLGRKKKEKKKKKNPVRLSVEVLKPDGQDLELQDLGFGTWTHRQTSELI